MIFNVYAIRDKLNGFGQLQLDHNDDTSIRNFAFGLQSGVFSFAASDYDLYQIGTYDIQSGLLTSLPVPRHIISGTDAKNLYQR